jgi:hypothetical protein
VNTAHPEFETLAELADLPDSADESGAAEALADVEARAHVKSCAQCSAEIAALQDVRTMLRALPEISMPEDVAGRIESALRAAAADVATGTGADAASGVGADVPESVAAVTVLPERSAGLGAPTGRLPLGHRIPHFSAAAAVAVLLVVALGAGIAAMVHQRDSTKSTNATSAGSSEPAILTASGSDYANTSIRNQVAALILAQVPDSTARYADLTPLAHAGSKPLPAASSAAASAAGGAAFGAQPSSPVTGSAPAAAPGAQAESNGTAAGTPSASGAQTATNPSAATTPAAALQQVAPTAPGGPLASKAALQACIVALVDQPVTPILVDYALFNGKPATILVLPDPTVTSLLDIYVEYYTTPCVQNGDVTFFATLPAGS